jgi:hypothetical protein
MNPPISIGETIQGGTHVPFVQSGQIVPGVSTITGGTKVKFRTIGFMAAELVSYRPGVFHGSLAHPTEAQLSQSNLCYYLSGVHRPGGEAGDAAVSIQKSDRFLAWGKRVIAWARRRTTATVPVGSGTAVSQCTPHVAEAHAAGLRLTW